ncbi:CsbD family protein [Nocardia sp. NPDC006630]|uniref:microaggregate-binding protein 1 n=1 Tax=Nocardia sp. NPDC006630 TaxID=3157181 RepID=UPI0033AB1DA2
MSEHNSGPREGLEGVVEGVKGKAKEAAGAVLGNDDLREEGRAQQDKADSQREAAQKEAAAEKERAVAALDEQRQRAHQRGQ